MYSKNMKCDYCYQIYYDASEDAQMDGKLWIECTGCKKWNHTDCEITTGSDKSMRQVALDLNEQVALENSRPPNEAAS
jgi:phage FluMu protein Com